MRPAANMTGLIKKAICGGCYLDGLFGNDDQVPWTVESSRVLGRRVGQFRNERSLSQEALAHLAGVSKNHVQVIEAAGRPDSRKLLNLRLETLYGLAEALGVDPWDLVR